MTALSGRRGEAAKVDERKEGRKKERKTDRQTDGQKEGWQGR